MQPTADAVLDAISGQMTAKQIAERLGHSTPRQIVSTLYFLRGQGSLTSRVDKEGNPVMRWRLAQ